jgi:hypothetical protein
MSANAAQAILVVWRFMSQSLLVTPFGRHPFAPWRGESGASRRSAAWFSSASTAPALVSTWSRTAVSSAAPLPDVDFAIQAHDFAQQGADRKRQRVLRIPFVGTGAGPEIAGEEAFDLREHGMSPAAFTAFRERGWIPSSHQGGAP